MGPHLRIVAGEFRIAGLLLGIPSVAAFAYLLYSIIDLRSVPAPPPDHSSYLDIEKYGLVGLLNNGIKGVGAVVGKPLEVAAQMAMRLMEIAAVASFAAALFAVLLYVIGRGIAHHATWARIFGAVLTIMVLLVSVMALTSLPRDLAPYAALPIALSLYTLWTLGWRFA
jgi:hypothetical protein